MSGSWSGGKGDKRRPQTKAPKMDFLAKKSWRCSLISTGEYLDTVETSAPFLAAKYLGYKEEELIIKLVKCLKNYTTPGTREDYTH